MNDLTTYRRKIVQKLKNAQEQVKKYEEHLAMIDAELQGDEFQLPETPIISSHINLIVSSPKKDRIESFAKKTRDFVLRIEEEFNTRGVAQAIRSQLIDASDIDEEVLIRKVSSAVWRLKREGRIAIVHKGAGSEPNIYKILSQEDEDDILLGIESKNTENKVNEQ